MSDPEIRAGSSGLVTIRRYSNVWEAQTTCNRLVDAGIPAFVTEAETNTMLSHIGSALGGVRVRVAAEDEQQALQILADDAERAEAAGHWQCSRCDEINEPAFDLCWSCSKPRSDEDRLVDPPDPDPEDDYVTSFDDQVAKTKQSLPVEDLSPYRPVLSDTLGRAPQPNDELTAAEIEDAEHQLRYAFRAAVLGFALPLLLTLYSTTLLLKLVGRHGGVPAAVSGRFWLTCVLNLLGIAWAACWLTIFLSQT